MADHIAGNLGNKNKNTAIGKGIRQEDHRNHFDFDFRRSASEDGEDTMGEISRLIREFYRQIALLEYRLEEQEKKFNVAVVVIAVLLLLVLWKLYFVGVEVRP